MSSTPPEPHSDTPPTGGRSTSVLVRLTLMLASLAGYLVKEAWGLNWAIVVFLVLLFGSGLVIELIRQWYARRRSS